MSAVIVEESALADKINWRRRVGIVNRCVWDVGIFSSVVDLSPLIELPVEGGES